MARKRTVKAPQLEQDAIDKLVLLLVSGTPARAIEEAAPRLGIEPAHIGAAIAQARRAITIAADYNRDQEVGVAYTRLNDLYRRALAVQDVKTALASQRELNKLLNLYRDSPTALSSAPDHSAGEAEAARDQLLTLGVGSKTDSLAELARLAVARVVELETRGRR